MTKSSTVFRGVVHGRVIELESEPGLPDGQEVSVTVEAVSDPSVTSITAPQSDVQRRWAEAQARIEKLRPGEGLERSFGAWADDAEDLDDYLADIRRRRKLGRPGIEP